MFRPVERKPQDARLSILGVGRLVEKKGFELLIRACARMASDGHDFVCTIVGEGPEHDALDKLIRQCGLQTVVKLVGAMNNDEVRAMMLSADMFVLPCRETLSGDMDGIPVVLMEAMACRVPVITGDLPAIRELVIHGHTGLLVNPSDPGALSNAIVTLSLDNDMRVHLADNGRRAIEQEFSTQLNVDRLLAAFESAHHSHSPAGGLRHLQA
jgi:colanic acid/amylovoran biosynthesis glycosyltransferase